MSTRGSIILTKDYEHWYEETSEYSGGETNIYIDIGDKNIVYHEKDEEGVMIGIRGDCHLARIIKKMHELDDE